MLDPREVIQRYPEHGGTLYGLLRSRAIISGEHACLVFDGHTLTWAAFRDRVDALAVRLQDKGVRAGMRVALAGENCARYLLAVFALAKLGAVCVPVNPELGMEEIAYIVGHAGISGAITSHRLSDVVRAACASQSLAPWYASFDADESEVNDIWRAFDISDTRTQTPSCAQSEDTWVILYTSGTTGFPKGVMHSQHAFTLIAEAFVERMHLQPDDRLLCMLPLFHINALFYSVGGAFAAGACLVLEPRFSASRFWRVAAESRATEVNIIAAVGNILARRPQQEFDSGHCLAKVYGAPITAEIADVFNHRFGINKLVEGYGLTEAPGVCNQPFTEPPNIGSMGKPARHPGWDGPFVEMRLVDDVGVDVPIGTPGEVLVRTPAMMQGYYKDAKQTHEAFTDGWFKTGDIARRDTDGFYYFVCRKKDIIRRRGENISAAEVERTIKLHPSVEDVAVIAAPDAVGEEELFAVVRQVDGGSLDAADVAAWCRTRLAAYKVPRYVTFVNELPYTPSHRIVKHRLTADSSLFARAIDLTAKKRGCRTNGIT